MEFTYETKVKLCIEGIKDEELISVLNVGSIDGYKPRLVKVSPEVEYDYEGWPIRQKGTYCVEFETGVCGIDTLDILIHFTKESHEELYEIEKVLTK